MTAFYKVLVGSTSEQLRNSRRTQNDEFGAALSGYRTRWGALERSRASSRTDLFERSNSKVFAVTKYTMCESSTSGKYSENRRRASERQPENILENSSESLESACANGQVLCTHDGILLRHASADFISDLNTSGSLSLVQYSMNNYIEWRPNDIIITDDEVNDQDEWALVDTIAKRTRTRSESKVFNTKFDSPPKPRCLRVKLSSLKELEILFRGQVIRLINKDGNRHSEYFFQNGNANLFVTSMQQLGCINRPNGNKNIVEIFDVEAQKLKKTFDELQIGEIKEAGGWFSNMNSFFAKISDVVAPNPHIIHSTRTPLRTDEYEVLETGRVLEQNSETAKDLLPERKILKRGYPLTEKQWREFQTEDGRISDPTRIKEIIFRGGIEHNLRHEIWKYLLNYYQWEATTTELMKFRQQKKSEYFQMKAQWLSMSVAQERNFSGYKERKVQIEKDVQRTDRTHDFFAGEDNPNLALLQDILMTYVMYNFDLGYVQGMSDLLAPILSVQEDEVDAFWCFVGFMDIVFPNFDIDQAGMKRQLSELKLLLEFCNHELFEYLKSKESDNMYFCFRWLLVWYKREFSSTDIIELWECLWTKLPCPNFHLFVAVAILDQQKDTFMQNSFEFNEILKHVNELSMKIDLRRTLELAESIYGQLKSSECLTNEIRAIIGHELIENPKDDKEYESEDGFDDIVREPTPEELELRHQKFEEACDQSMFLSYL